MNVGEYGVKFRVGTGFDLTAATGLALSFTKPDEVVLDVSTGVTVGVGTIVTPVGTLPSGTWAEYVWLVGQVDQSGTWTVRLIYDDATGQHLISELATFVVGE